MYINMMVDYYSQQLEAINYEALWIGNNVMEKIGGLSEKTAFIQPIPEIHSVAELIAHMTSLQIEVANKIRERHSIQQKYQPNYWRSNEELKTIGWKQLKEEYETSIVHLSLYIWDKPDSFLKETYTEDNHKTDYPFGYALEGVIHHILYHLGQIGITIKLLIAKELHV
ncbi:DinB family protein [Dokdonia ponticola]|uniref:DinB family protein n=1 Tax=Dokdonia ponticola TaxID=2041041 RepID=A0ABV9HW56_9FLAO